MLTSYCWLIASCLELDIYLSDAVEQEMMTSPSRHLSIRFQKAALLLEWLVCYPSNIALKLKNINVTLS